MAETNCSSPLQCSFSKPYCYNVQHAECELRMDVTGHTLSPKLHSLSPFLTSGFLQGSIRQAGILCHHHCSFCPSWKMALFSSNAPEEPSQAQPHITSLHGVGRGGSVGAAEEYLSLNPTLCTLVSWAAEAGLWSESPLA